MRFADMLKFGLLCLGLAACAGANQQLMEQVETSQAEMREEMEALKRAVEASYDRERAMAERLRLAEESEARQGEALRQLQQQLDGLRGQFKSPPAPVQAPAIAAEDERAQRLDALKLYSEALDNRRMRHYDLAIEQFTRLLDTVPRDELADNAQYWIGECHYLLGKYRPALTAFTSVFAYSKTEKADDAQLMIARCYRELGERDKARAAFQKLLTEYPESEYVPTARRELQDLGEP